MVDGATPSRVLVTGASSGIGAAVAKRLLAAGWAVIGMSRTRPSFAHAQFTHIAADFAEEQALTAALNAVGTVDALVHAAGVMLGGALGALNRADGQAM